MKDLFEHYQDQPENLKEICDKWSEKEATEGLTYKDCKDFLKEVEAIGYTFDYGLSAEPFNLRKIEPTDLNMLFIDQIRNFAHLVTVKSQTKSEFLNSIKSTYSTENPKTTLFYQATQKSKFNTIRLSDDRSQVLFNQ